MRLLLPCALALVACQFDTSTRAGGSDANPSAPDADPSAPDADPNAPDADPNAPDAMPCADWALTPALFDPCADIVMVGDSLMLLADNTYVFDTDDGSLRTVSDMTLVNVEHVAQLVPNSDDDPNAPMALIANNFTVEKRARLRVIGSRPALLVAWGNMFIAGEVDASSNYALFYPVGSGANPDDCSVATKGGDDGAGGGGGGGGGFGGQGGDGAVSGRDPSISGGTGGAMSAISFRGGCPGAVGGSGSGSEILRRGDGGGALHFTARALLQIEGTIKAGGAGGQGANTNRAGGDGGGSGGYIGLEAFELSIMSTAVIAANGGGGGGGAKEQPQNARPGSPGLTQDMAAQGGEGEPIGDGGVGGYSAVPAGQNGVIGDRGSGGGGGGVGYITRRTNMPVYGANTTYSPDPSP